MISKVAGSRARKMYAGNRNKKVLYDPLWMARFASTRFEDEVITRVDGEDKQKEEEQWKRLGIDLSFLTKRQAEILRLIADGLTYNEVADYLGVTDGTVKKHMLQLRKKTKNKKGNVIQLSFLTNDEE